MKTHENRFKTGTTRSVAGSIARASQESADISFFHDQRPATLAQRKLQSNILQAKINSPFQKSAPTPSIIKIQQQIELYNNIGGWRVTFSVEERSQALNQLSVVEHMAYQWFTDNPSHDFESDPVAVKMKQLLNQIQIERRDLVTRSIEKQDENPPVANFGKLDKEIQQQVKFLWQSLLKNNKIIINGEKGFFIQIMSDFSRLLETQMGQRLISGILLSDKGLVITPTSLEHGKFIASPIDYEKEGFIQVNPEEHDTSDFIELDMTKSSKHEILDVLQDLRVKHPKCSGMRVISAEGVLCLSFNIGTGSNLPVPTDAVDAHDHNSSRMSDESGNEVIAPTFINLGHELGHVLRSAQGMSAAYQGGKLVKHGFPEGLEFPRPEEFFNIEGVENILRKQSGIALRFGHGNLYSHWAVSMMNNTESLQKKIDKMTELLKATPEAIKLLEEVEKVNFQLRDHIQELMNGIGSISKLLDACEHLTIRCSEIRKKYVPIEIPMEEAIVPLTFDREPEELPVKKQQEKEKTMESEPESEALIQISTWAEVREYVADDQVELVYRGEVGTKVKGRKGELFILQYASGSGQFALKFVE